VLRAAVAHRGSAFVEIYQNCNVFNDKAFVALTGREERDENRINLEQGKPIVFGKDQERGITLTGGSAKIVDVAEVGMDAIHVHDATTPDSGPAFALSRISHGPFGPTPVGIFRDAPRAVYEDGLQQQVHDALEKRGPGDIGSLIASTGTWTVE